MGGKGSYQALPKSDGSKDNQHLHARLLAESEQGKELNWQGVNRFWVKRTIADLSSHRLSSFALFFNKLRLFFSRDYVPLDTNFVLARTKIPLLYPLAVGFFPLLLLAMFALITQKKWPAPIIATFIGILLINILFYVSDRYRLPAAALLTIPAAHGLQNIWMADKKYRYVSLTLILLLLTFSAYQKPAPKSQDLARFNYAQQLESGDSLENALQIYSSLASEKPSAARLHAKARVLLKQNKNQQAKTVTLKALKQFPESTTLINDLGVANLRSGNLNSAANNFNSVLKGNSKHTGQPIAWLNLAAVNVKTDDHDLAIDNLKHYLRFYPHSAKGWLKLAKSCYEVKNQQATNTGLNAAKQAYKLALDNNKIAGKSKNLEGLFWETKKDLTQAKAAYELAAQLLPDSPYPLLNLALQYKQLGDDEKYQEYLKAARLRGLKEKR
jgi:tetratricopeptide (TPR) repeat protein